MTKRCSICDEEKPLGAFNAQVDGLYGTKTQCTFCYNARQRAYVKRTLKARARRMQEYGRTREGKIMRMYWGMKMRVLGYRGKTKSKVLLPKVDFYRSVLRDKTFQKLYKEWAASGFSRAYSPSVRRHDTAKGYSMDNIYFSGGYRK